MEYIEGWLKSILYLNILILLCEEFLRQTSYKKYIHFFTSFLLVLCLLQPVLSFGALENKLDASVLKHMLKNELKLASGSGQTSLSPASEKKSEKQWSQKLQDSKWKDEYKEVVESQMQEYVEAHGYDLTSIRIYIEDSSARLGGLWVKVGEKDKQARDGQEEGARKQQELIDLKEEISARFQLDSAQIHLTVVSKDEE